MGGLIGEQEWQAHENKLFEHVVAAPLHEVFFSYFKMEDFFFKASTFENVVSGNQNFPKMSNALAFQWYRQQRYLDSTRIKSCSRIVSVRMPDFRSGDSNRNSGNMRRARDPSSFVTSLFLRSLAWHYNWVHSLES